MQMNRARSALAGVLLLGVAATACYESGAPRRAVVASTDTVSASVSSGAATKQVVTRIGGAILRLLDADSGGSVVSAGFGDTIEVVAQVDGGSERVTGAELFLTLDDDVVELVPDSDTPLRPFGQGDYVVGDVFENRTIDDRVGPGFQMHYFENVRPSPFGPAQAATGTGTLATFRMRVLANIGTTVAVDLVSPTGGRTGYFVEGRPGERKDFERVETLRIEPRPVLRRRVVPVPDGRCLVDVILLRSGHPVESAMVEVTRSVAGRQRPITPAIPTGADGTARMEIEGGTSGYYEVRALDADGSLLGAWNSVPLNPGFRHLLTYELD